LCGAGEAWLGECGERRMTGNGEGEKDEMEKK